MKPTTTTSTAAGSPPDPDDKALADLNEKLKNAEKELQKWSALVEKAILGEEGHKEKKLDYKERETLYLKRVTDLEAQIKELTTTTKGAGVRMLTRLNEKDDGLLGFVVSETSQHKRLILSSPDPPLSLQSRVVHLKKQLWNNPSGTATIYLRECYREFAALVHEYLTKPTCEVMIAGTRGIGKSVFGLLMLLELVDQGNVVLYEHQKVKMLIIGPNARKDQLEALERVFILLKYNYVLEEGVYWFTNDDSALFSGFRTQNPLITIQDLGDDRYAELHRTGFGRRIVLTSPNNKQLAISHQVIGLRKVFMPRWSFSELEDLRNQSFPAVSKELLQEQYEFYGGIPRFILELSPAESMAHFRYQLGQVKIAELAELFRTGEFHELPHQKKTSYLIHVVPDVKDDGTKGFKCVFASDAISKLVAEQFARDQDLNVQAFAHAVRGVPQFAAWSGYMLEAYAHSRLPLGKKRPMITLSSKLALTEWDVPKMDASTPPYHEIRDLAEVKPGYYLRPLRQNYPTLDALVVLSQSVFNPNGLALVFLQYAKGREHVANGTVLSRVHGEVFDKLDKSLFSLPPPSKRKKVTAPEIKDLPMILVFGTVEGGINKAMTITTDEGVPYKRGEPAIDQYAMIMETEYQELFKIWNARKS